MRHLISSLPVLGGYFSAGAIVSAIEGKPVTWLYIACGFTLALAVSVFEYIADRRQ